MLQKSVAAGILSLFLCVPALAQDLQNDATFMEVWKDFSRLSEKLVDMASSKTSKEPSLLNRVTLSEPRYVRLLKEAQEILGVTDSHKYYEKALDIQQEIKEAKEDILDLKKDRIAAPESSKNPFNLSRKTIDERIARLEQEIQDYQSGIEQQRNKVIESFARMGIQLSPEQADYFFIAAEGNELMQLMAIAENMKKMQLFIEEALRGESNIELMRVYAGMYLVSLDAYDTAHEVAIERLTLYKQRVKEIENKADELYKQARAMMTSLSAQERKPLEANLRINETTSRVAALYHKVLDRREVSLKEARSDLARRLDIARNTYNTLNNGAQLISLVRSADNDYRLLTDFRMPELKTFYEKGMLDAFTEISEKIKD